LPRLVEHAHGDVGKGSAHQAARRDAAAPHRVCRAHAADLGAAIDHEQLGLVEHLLHLLEQVRRHHVAARRGVAQVVKGARTIVGAQPAKQVAEQARSGVQHRDLLEHGREALRVEHLVAVEQDHARADSER
jgi:hypothetical protein